MLWLSKTLTNQAKCPHVQITTQAKICRNPNTMLIKAGSFQIKEEKT